MVDYSLKAYAEENEIPQKDAYKQLHCDCENEINCTYKEKEIEFDSIQDYIRWFKKFGKG